MDTELRDKEKQLFVSSVWRTKEHCFLHILVFSLTHSPAAVIIGLPILVLFAVGCVMQRRRQQAQLPEGWEDCHYEEKEKLLSEGLMEELGGWNTPDSLRESSNSGRSIARSSRKLAAWRKCMTIASHYRNNNSFRWCAEGDPRIRPHIAVCGRPRCIWGSVEGTMILVRCIVEL